jgi:hypothetical protein
MDEIDYSRLSVVNGQIVVAEIQDSQAAQPAIGPLDFDRNAHDRISKIWLR